jgi:periplasmic protein TonB
MKTKSASLEKWEDIVFENRNKSYGAYFIRTSYSDNLAKALMIGSFAVLIMILLPSLVSSFMGTKVHKLPIIADGEKIIWDNIKPQIIPNEIPKARIATNNDLIPVVTSRDVVETPPPIETPATTNNIEGTTDGTASLTDGGTIDVQANVDATNIAPVTNTPEIIVDAQKMPTYIGGQSAMVKFLTKNLRYPASARRMGTSGVVYVSFVINVDGKVILPKVEKGIDKECDEEALRIVSKMPNWIAGAHNNKPAMVRLMLPIKFQMANF